MDAQDVIDIYSLLEKNGVRVWIDGGWGIDALLEKQTRPHGDLDIAIERKYVFKLRRLLKEYKRETNE